jgi:hypothetical protein
MSLLAQQAQVSTTTVWRETKKLPLLPCKIGQVQTVEEGDYKRLFLTGFCRLYITELLT